MSITAYTGLPGHGKSYGVVDNVIRSALEKKITVYTNIPMNVDECIKRYSVAPVQFKIEDIKNDASWWSSVFEAGAILVLDECWRLWPNGMTAKNVRDEDKAFLAEHRHLVGSDNYRSTEVVLVTQDLGQISKFARDLVETTFIVNKLTKLGSSKSFRIDVFSRGVTGKPPVSGREREILGRFKPSVYSLYQSHTKSSVGAGDESRTDNRFNVLGGIGVKLWILLFLGLAVGVYYMSKSMIAFYVADDLEVVESTTLVKASSSESVQRVSKPRFLGLADSIYYTGFFTTKFRDKVSVSYNFELTFDDDVMNLDQLALLRLGYDIEFVSDCVVRVTGYDFDKYVTCSRERDSKSFVESLASGASSSVGS